MKRVFALLLLSLFLLLSISTSFAAETDVHGRPLVLTIDVEGMITPGTAAKMKEEYRKRRNEMLLHWFLLLIHQAV